jgi:hypothetical protein
LNVPRQCPLVLLVEAKLVLRKREREREREREEKVEGR